MDYVEFLGNVLLFRTTRDMNCSCSPGNQPELWLDIELEHISANAEWADGEKQQLILTAKVADLLDDRKVWLLEEIHRDLYLIEHPGQWNVDVTLPSDGQWEAHDQIRSLLGEDDSGASCGGWIDTESGSLTFTANIKAESREEAEAIFQERIETVIPVVV